MHWNMEYIDMKVEDLPEREKRPKVRILGLGLGRQPYLMTIQCLVTGTVEDFCM